MVAFFVGIIFKFSLPLTASQFKDTLAAKSVAKFFTLPTIKGSSKTGKTFKTVGALCTTQSVTTVPTPNETAKSRLGLSLVVMPDPRQSFDKKRPDGVAELLSALANAGKQIAQTIKLRKQCRARINELEAMPADDDEPIAEVIEETPTEQGEE